MTSKYNKQGVRKDEQTLYQFLMEYQWGCDDIFRIIMKLGIIRGINILIGNAAHNIFNRSKI